MELLALVGVILSIAGVVRFWMQRRDITQQNKIKFAGKAMSQMHELASLLDKVDRTFTREYLSRLERELDPETFNALVTQVERARELKGASAETSMPWLGRKLAMVAMDDSRISLEEVVEVTVAQERMITNLRDYFRPYDRDVDGAAT